MPSKPEDKDKYFNDEEKKIDWDESLDITKGAVPFKQSMQMDNTTGVIYFAVKTDAGQMKILRVDPDADMGSADFIKSVFTMRCEYIHFFTISNQKFYVMDDKKKIRRLVQDPITFQLRLDITQEMLPQDQ